MVGAGIVNTMVAVVAVWLFASDVPSMEVRAGTTTLVTLRRRRDHYKTPNSPKYKNPSKRPKTS